jgi:outer membrane lipoprotein-sorting protein
VSARKLLSSVLLILSLSGGCVIALPPPYESVTGEPRRAVTLLLARWSEFSDFRALADVRLSQNGRRQQFIGALLLKTPASLRFEALSPLGQPVLLTTIHEGHFALYDVGAHAAKIGPATSRLAGRLIHIAIDPDDLVGLLVGRTVPPKDLRAATILPPDEDGPSLEMVGGVHRQRVWMDFTTGVVRQVQITGGRLEALVTYQIADDGALAGFDLTAAQGNVTGSVRYRDAVVGTGIDAARFRLKIPPGAVIERLR